MEEELQHLLSEKAQIDLDRASLKVERDLFLEQQMKSEAKLIILEEELNRQGQRLNRQQQALDAQAQELELQGNNLAHENRILVEYRDRLEHDVASRHQLESERDKTFRSQQVDFGLRLAMQAKAEEDLRAKG